MAASLPPASFPQTTSPVTIYVDSAAGDDSAAGTSASPYLSLARVNAAVTPGSTVNLKAASVWNETLIAPDRVTVQSYGAGASPRISGGKTANLSGQWAQLVITNVASDTETFASSTLSSYWTTKAGVQDTTKGPTGFPNSWKYASASGDLTTQTSVSMAYAEYTGWLYVDSASTATTGQKCRVMGFESSGAGGTSPWNNAAGMWCWLRKNGTAFELVLAAGAYSTLSAAATVTANTWTQFRLVVSANNGAGLDSINLYWAGASSPSAQLTGLTLPAPATQLEWGAFAYNPTAFSLSFGNFQVWAAPSTGTVTNSWYLSGITVEPMVVTLNGSLGQRKFYQTALSANGDYSFEASASRLYVQNSAGNPTATWSAIEYSQRVSPVQAGSGCTLTGFTVSHHNLDDGTIGIANTGFAPTLSSVTGQTNAKDTVDYYARPGRGDSVFNTQLTGSNTYTVLTPGFSTLGSGLINWSSPKAGISIFKAIGTDPLVNVYYHPLAYTNVANATWFRIPGGGASQNTTAIETTIRSGSSGTFPVSGTFAGVAFGSASRHVYASTSTLTWSMPAYPFTYAADPSPGPRQIRCPSGSLPDTANDGNMTVYQPDGTVMEMYAAIVLANGDIVCLNYNLSNPGAKADYINMPGTRESLLANYVGPIRSAEVTAGAINHALALIMPRNGSGNTLAALQASIAYPAGAFDRTPGYSGNIAMGSRFAIPYTTTITSLNLLSTAGTMMAKAAQTYGAVVVGSGGSGISVLTEFAMPAGDFTTYSGNAGTDLTTILNAMRLVG